MAGVIEPARPKYLSFIVLVYDKDGMLRFFENFRSLSAATLPDIYPLSRIDDRTGSLVDAKLFIELNAL